VDYDDDDDDEVEEDAEEAEEVCCSHEKYFYYHQCIITVVCITKRVYLVYLALRYSQQDLDVVMSLICTMWDKI
jgi:hypothetical protein